MKALIILQVLIHGAAAGLLQKTPFDCSGTGCPYGIRLHHYNNPEGLSSDCSSYLLTINSVEISVTTTTSTALATHTRTTSICPSTASAGPLPPGYLLGLPPQATTQSVLFNASVTSSAISSISSNNSKGGKTLPTYASKWHCLPDEYVSACSCAGVFPNLVVETIYDSTQTVIEYTVPTITVSSCRNEPWDSSSVVFPLSALNSSFAPSTKTITLTLPELNSTASASISNATSSANATLSSFTGSVTSIFGGPRIVTPPFPFTNTTSIFRPSSDGIIHSASATTSDLSSSEDGKISVLSVSAPTEDPSVSSLPINATTSASSVSALATVMTNSTSLKSSGNFPLSTASATSTISGKISSNSSMSSVSGLQTNITISRSASSTSSEPSGADPTNLFSLSSSSAPFPNTLSIILSPTSVSNSLSLKKTVSLSTFSSSDLLTNIIASTTNSSTASLTSSFTTISSQSTSPTPSICVPSVANITTTNQGYQAIYAANYSGCAIDPDSSTTGLQIYEATKGGLIVNINGLASLAPDTSSFRDTYYTFQKPPKAPCGIYDLVFHYENKTSYFAIFSNSVVGFVPLSSNGQELNTTDQQFVTTIWSTDCSGELRAGVPGDVEFFFTVDSDGTKIIANSVNVKTASIARSLGKRATRMRLKAVPITPESILRERNPEPRPGLIVKGPLHPLSLF